MRQLTTEDLKAETISAHGRVALQAQVTPGLGANLISFTVDGTELIYWDAPGLLAGETFTGAFTMFPTPCRLANAGYEFEGRRVEQRKYGEPVFIHGLLRDESLQYRIESNRITSWLDITPEHPVYEGFPYRCRFSVTHALQDDSLTVSFALDNRDICNIPFGYGIHPFWRLHGTREEMVVRIPCDYTLDLEELIPTGGCTPVAGTPLDLRAGKSLQDLYIDNAFWKRNPGDSAEIGYRALGKSLVITASDNFPHMIVYAPEGQPFVCVENLTTCPNAPNLVSAGHGQLANMLVAAPATSVTGLIKYTIK